MISALRLHIVIIITVLFIACTIDYNVYRAVRRRKRIYNDILSKIDEIFNNISEEKQGNKMSEPVKGNDYAIDPVFERKIADVMDAKSNIGRDVSSEGVIRHRLYEDDAKSVSETISQTYEDIAEDKANKERVRLGITDDTFGKLKKDVTVNRGKISRDSKDTENS